MNTLQLTAEQQTIVAHTHGPARVFAVAGAGKTTAMVYRIERLVRERVFAPERILATSFNRDTVDEVSARLKTWISCQSVQCLSLHGLGWRVLKQAIKQQLLPPHAQLPSAQQPDKAIFWETLKQARQEPHNFPDLGPVEPDEFLEYVSRCKAHLQYPEQAYQNLPPALQRVARVAQAPDNLPLYLPLLERYEQIRRQRALFTFDDLLCEAWELLGRYPGLLAHFQQLFDCVLVDEFQDVNLAQSEMLDLLTATHRNYMVIGDDDQTIYTWRGASADFILGFAKRYQAQSYYMSENFRSHASQLALANLVIQHNRGREPKSLYLTRGFGGLTTLQQSDTPEAMATEIVRLIEARRAGGVALNNMVVLVRNWSQTALLEPRLLQAGIPYLLPKDKRFFTRPEVQDLLAYVQLAGLEAGLAKGQRLSEDQKEALVLNWSRIQNRPNRYLSNVLAQQILLRVLAGESLHNSLRLEALTCEDYLIPRLHALADTLAQLTRDWLEQVPASDSLQRLERDLGYCDWLVKNAAQPELGTEKAESVIAFLSFANDQPSLPALLEKVGHLSRDSRQTPPNVDAVAINSLHIAKGREWDVVILPACHHGVFPAFKADAAQQAEACRLLYVGLTRCREELHIFKQTDQYESPFLAGASRRLLQVQELTALLQQPAEQWRWSDFQILMERMSELDYELWFCRHNPFSEALNRRISGWVHWQEQYRPHHPLPHCAVIWYREGLCAEDLLSAEACAELEGLYTPQRRALVAHEVRHPRHGIGTVLRRVEASQGRMVVVQFKNSGKVQLPCNDPELEWGPLD